MDVLAGTEKGKQTDLRYVWFKRVGVSCTIKRQLSYPRDVMRVQAFGRERTCWEMLAAKRHTGAHSPVSGAKTIIANSNQFAYAA
jgi:hypothetical protein